MSKESNTEAIFGALNRFRIHPSNNQKIIQTFAKVLKKMKEPEIAKELEDLANHIKGISPMNEFIFSEGLSKVAEENLISILKSSGKLVLTPEKKLHEKISQNVSSFEGILEISDVGDLTHVLGRIAVSNLDPERKIQNALLDTETKYCGVASSDFEDEAISVIIFAKNIVELEKIDYGEEQPLKEAFDLFDVFNTGLLDQFALKQAFEALGFHKDNYSVYKVMVMLNGNNKVKKQGGVDWETFRDAVLDLVGDYESKEGLRKMFELFVDDPKEDKITAESIKSVGHDIGDELTYNEISKVLKRACKNGTDIDFDEFCKIMEEYKELHPETES